MDASSPENTVDDKLGEQKISDDTVTTQESSSTEEEPALILAAKNSPNLEKDDEDNPEFEDDEENFFTSSDDDDENGNSETGVKPSSVLAWAEVISRPDLTSKNEDEPVGKVCIVVPSNGSKEQIIEIRHYRRLDTSSFKSGMHIPVYVEARQNDDPRSSRFELRVIIVITLDPEDDVTIAVGNPNETDTWVYGAMFYGCRVADIEGFADGDFEEGFGDKTLEEEDINVEDENKHLTDELHNVLGDINKPDNDSDEGKISLD